ncbi:Gfo/Idh/MocA family oxidoreductase [Exiguobacterium antarcticum]|uniref:Gfo/Idh/MocA family oxidoreductase n=1 Tax=Exiguobacterium antarcticum TaxID=132920 RepID=A0ABT6R0R0_9BACL|nr:Gfo/Idh/MocA family oxidoreductase [Exiguobacterium antarcticum]MDI3234387.1 Gfo/Idh/MocA family oxidoreductase [Exiguobacterium antarcticum]
MTTIQTMLVGFGFSAVTFHAPLLQALPQFTVRQVVSSQQDKVATVFPEAKVIGTLEEALQDEQTELVIITTPTALHFEMAKQAIEAKKHVLLEKPAVVTMDEADELIRLAAHHGVHVAVYQNRRFDGDFLTIEQLIEMNEIGDWQLLESRFDRYRPVVRNRWREQKGPGSGILFDLGSHLIDQALALFGEPDAVVGDVLFQRDGAETDDGFHVTLCYGKRRVILRSNSFIQGLSPRFELHATRGSYIKYGMDPQEARLASGHPVNETIGQDLVTDYGYLQIADQPVERLATLPGSYLGFYEALAAGLVTGALPVDLTDALRTMQVLNAVRLSSETGRKVMRKEWDGWN